MKQVIKFLFICLSVLSITGCVKEPSFDYDENTVGSSRVVYFPSVAIKGERLVILEEGDAYTEEGAEALLNGEAMEFTTTGSVDVNTPGVYDLEYTAESPEGFSASDWRTVVVIGDDVPDSRDFSGTYNRPLTGVSATWTKISRGVYEVENPGGSGPGAGLVAILVNYTGNEIKIPRQQVFDPSIPGINVMSTNSENYKAEQVPVSVDYKIDAGGYGTALRTFVKQ